MSNPLLRGIKPAHPGQVLREDVLPALKSDYGISATKFAGLLGISRQTLYAIAREEQPVTPRIAVRLGHVLGNSAEFWAHMQLAHDIRAAAENEDLSVVEPLRRTA